MNPGTFLDDSFEDKGGKVVHRLECFSVNAAKAGRLEGMGGRGENQIFSIVQSVDLVLILTRTQ